VRAGGGGGGALMRCGWVALRWGWAGVGTASSVNWFDWCGGGLAKQDEPNDDGCGLQPKTSIRCTSWWRVWLSGRHIRVGVWVGWLGRRVGEWGASLTSWCVRVCVCPESQPPTSRTTKVEHINPASQNQAGVSGWCCCAIG
jgi:hypothetical protein